MACYFVQPVCTIYLIGKQLEHDCFSIVLSVVFLFDFFFTNVAVSNHVYRLYLYTIDQPCSALRCSRPWLLSQPIKRGYSLSRYDYSEENMI